MGVCDICNSPGMGTLVSAEQMRQAVFKSGFNPFKLGLVNNPMVTMVGKEPAYQDWKTRIVAQDTSDWNICSGCMGKLKPYLKDKPKSTGVNKSWVSFNPQVAEAAGENAEKKYSAPKKETKKWWEFWK